MIRINITRKLSSEVTKIENNIDGISSWVSEFVNESYGVASSLISELNATAFFTLLLFIATVAYVLVAYLQIKAKFRPILTASVEHKTPTSLALVIRNTGTGAAYDISANWGFEELEGSHTDWEAPVMPPGKEFEFFIPCKKAYDEEGNEEPRREGVLSKSEIMESIEDCPGTLDVEIQYEDGLEYSNFVKKLDIFNKLGDYSVDKKIDIKNYISAKENSGELYNKEPLQEIKDEINSVSDNLKNLDRLMRKIRPIFKSKLKSEEHEKIVKVVRNEREIYTSEIRGLSGVSIKQLYTALNNLEKRGLIETGGNIGNLISGDSNGNFKVIWVRGRKLKCEHCSKVYDWSSKNGMASHLWHSHNVKGNDAISRNTKVIYEQD